MNHGKRNGTDETFTLQTTCCFGFFFVESDHRRRDGRAGDFRLVRRHHDLRAAGAARRHDGRNHFGAEAAGVAQHFLHLAARHQRLGFVVSSTFR